MPHVSVHVDLDDFDDSDLKGELERRGFLVEKDAGLSTTGDLGRVEHLASCGFLADARQKALQLVGLAIGRAIH